MALIEMRHNDALTLRDCAIYANELAFLAHRIYLVQSELILFMSPVCRSDKVRLWFNSEGERTG